MCVLFVAVHSGEVYVDWIHREVNQRLGLDDPLLEPDISGAQWVRALLT